MGVPTEPEHHRIRRERLRRAEERAAAAHGRALHAQREAETSPTPQLAALHRREQSTHERAEQLHRSAAELQQAHLVEEEEAASEEPAEPGGPDR